MEVIRYTQTQGAYDQYRQMLGYQHYRNQIMQSNEDIYRRMNLIDNYIENKVIDKKHINKKHINKKLLLIEGV